MQGGAVFLFQYTDNLAILECKDGKQGLQSNLHLTDNLAILECKV